MHTREKPSSVTLGAAPLPRMKEKERRGEGRHGNASSSFVFSRSFGASCPVGKRQRRNSSCLSLQWVGNILRSSLRALNLGFGKLEKPTTLFSLPPLFGSRPTPPTYAEVSPFSGRGWRKWGQEKFLLPPPSPSLLLLFPSSQSLLLLPVAPLVTGAVREGPPATYVFGRTCTFI